MTDILRTKEIIHMPPLGFPRERKNVISISIDFSAEFGSEIKT